MRSVVLGLAAALALAGTGSAILFAQSAVKSAAAAGAAPVRCARFPAASSTAFDPITKQLDLPWRGDLPAAVPAVKHSWDGIKLDDWQAYMAAVLSEVRAAKPVISGKRMSMAPDAQWWISPWMDFTINGREPLHGLTRERSPDPGDLAPASPGKLQVWAVGFYNAEGGLGLRQVFQDPCDPKIPAGYSPEHVLEKVKPLIGEPPRIDLIIGTHYDEDHLAGLVPIIQDLDIEIGEAWMPPVANDTQAFPVDQPVTQSDLLAHQLSGAGGDQVLSAYLATKRIDIEALATFEQELDPDRKSGFRRVPQDALAMHRSDDPLDLSFFRGQLPDADGDDADHGNEQEIEPDPRITHMVETVTKGDYFWWDGPSTATVSSMAQVARNIGADAAEIAPLRSRSLARMRRAAAKEAINAKSLRDVVQALSARKIPIRSEIIEPGTPRHYRWTQATRRFVLAKDLGSGLGFSLLGPSRALVKKHRDRLPVLEASRIAMAFRGEIRSITPSNQLSYIGCFHHERQSILVSGDAGCVDFAETRKPYFPDLLKAMKPLHVIQVAHHGGNNAHFYRVLAAAGYPEQEEKSYLLLSHAEHDKTRPSDLFRVFLLTSLTDGDDIRVLFTSEPTRDKVQDYLRAIAQRVGGRGKKGDIALEFDGDWRVTAHAIEMV